MNIVTADPYTSHTCAIRSLMDKIEWGLRDRKPQPQIVGHMRDLQSHVIALEVFVVKDYKDRKNK